MLQPRHLTKRVAVTPESHDGGDTLQQLDQFRSRPALDLTCTSGDCNMYIPYIGYIYSLYSIYTWLTSLVDARFRSHRKIPKLQKPEGIEKITIFGAETPKNWWRPARDVIVMPSENFPTGGFCRKTDVGCWSWQFFVAHDKKIESYLATNFAGSRNPKIWGVPKSGIRGFQNPGGVPQNLGGPEISKFGIRGSKSRNPGNPGI